MIDPIEASRELCALRRRWVEGCAGRIPGRAPIRVGDGFAWIDARSRSPYASQNRNSLRFIGTEGALDWDALDQLWGRVLRSSVTHFFLYVNPSRNAEDLRKWASRNGFRAQTPYLVLVREGGEAPLARDGFLGEVVEPDMQEIRAVLGRRADREEIVQADGLPGLHVLGVRFGSELRAISSIYVQEGVGYLGHMWTHPSFRGRGAQASLIAARLGLAHGQGVRRCYAETYPFLETSLRNLQRAGFETRFERMILRWSR